MIIGGKRRKGVRFIKYPNLELLAYKAKEALARHDEIKEKIERMRRENKFLSPEYDVIVFSQIWGSTNTAFDVTKNGEAIIGGQVMTKEYIALVHELLTDAWVAFVDERLCYVVTNANENFHNDLKNHNMASFFEAGRRY